MSMAAEIAVFEISEPIAPNWEDLVIDEAGVGWWTYPAPRQSD